MLAHSVYRRPENPFGTFLICRVDSIILLVGDLNCRIDSVILVGDLGSG